MKPPAITDPELQSIGRIRSAAAWIRRTSHPVQSYPKYSLLSVRESGLAQQFATGNLPWPRRWTKHLFEIATKN